MKNDNCQYLPRAHPTMEWAITKPENLDPTLQVMVDFAYDTMEKNRRLEAVVKAQGKIFKKCQQVIDDHRESLDLPRIYDRLEPPQRP